MDSKPRPPADQTTRIYEDFDPAITWEREAGHDTLILQLQDFRKDQLKVQITTSHDLRISGERPLGSNKWKRFRKEIQLSTDYDSDEITARFENHQLYVKLPKLIAPYEPEPESPAADDHQALDPTPQKPASASDSLHAQTRGQEQATQRLPSKTGTGTGAVEKQRSGGDNLTGWSTQGVSIPRHTAAMQKQNGNKASGAASAKDGSQMSTWEREEVSQEVPPTTTVEKTTSRKASGAANAAAADDDQKVPGKPEKQQSIKNEKSGSASVDAEYAKKVSQKSSENKNEGLADDQTMKEKRNDLDGSAASGKDSDKEKFEEVEASNEGEDKSRAVFKGLKQTVGVSVMDLKNSRILKNFAVAVLFLVVSLLYARNAIRSITEKSNDFN